MNEELRLYNAQMVNYLMGTIDNIDRLSIGNKVNEQIINCTGQSLSVKDNNGLIMVIPSITKDKIYNQLSAYKGRDSTLDYGVYYVREYEIDPIINESIERAYTGVKRSDPLADMYTPFSTTEKTEHPKVRNWSIGELVKSGARGMDPLIQHGSPMTATLIFERHSKNLRRTAVSFIPLYELEKSPVYDERSNRVFMLGSDIHSMPDHPHFATKRTGSKYFVARDSLDVQEVYKDATSKIVYCPKDINRAHDYFTRAGSSVKRLEITGPSARYKPGHIYIEWLEYNKGENKNVLKTEEISLSYSTIEEERLLMAKLKEFEIYDSPTLATAAYTKDRSELEKSIYDYEVAKIKREIQKEDAEITASKHSVEKDRISYEERKLFKKEKEDTLQTVENVFRAISTAIGAIASIAVAIFGIVKLFKPSS